MSKIVIDCRMWGESGVGRYIRNLVSNLQKLDTKNEYYLLMLKKDFEDSGQARMTEAKNFHKILADFRWYSLTEQIRLPRILKQINPDLVHFPHFNVPVLYRGKFIVTIHDLIHQHYQMRRATTRDPLTYKFKSFGYFNVFKSAIRRSTKIIVPSDYVKNLLVSEWQVWDKKIVVTAEAVDENILRKGEASRVKGQGILDKFGIKAPYILYVGNAHPHKNVEGLIKAFFVLQKEHRSLQLVLVGGEHYFWEKVKEKYNIDSRFRGNDKSTKGIVFTGFVTDEELVALYKNAQVFVQPSFEEGFGIPILEAMACGCPVVSSNAGSLPEVGESAAVYFDPNDTIEMIGKIKSVLDDKNLRDQLIAKGNIRVKDFSWKKLAEQTLKIYKEVT